MSKRKCEWIFGSCDIPERTKRHYSRETVVVKESHYCSTDGSREACSCSAIESGRSNCVQHESGDCKCSSGDVDSCTSLIADASDNSDIVDYCNSDCDSYASSFDDAESDYNEDNREDSGDGDCGDDNLNDGDNYVGDDDDDHDNGNDDDDDDDDNGDDGANERLLQFIYQSQISLYPSSGSTLFDYQLAVFQFSLRHCLTKKAISDLLKLVPSFFPHNHTAIASWFKRKKFWQPLLDKSKLVTKHKYCAICHHLMLGDDNELCPNECNADFEHFVICVTLDYRLK